MMADMHLFWTIAISIAALAISAGVGSPLTAWVLHLAHTSRPKGKQPARHEAPGAVDREAEREALAEDALRGGTWIGVLERLAITGSLLAGYPAAIAVVIAIKGLGRFPELNASTAGASERFIIGTLTSCLWAAAIGLGAGAGLGALP